MTKWRLYHQGLTVCVAVLFGQSNALTAAVSMTATRRPCPRIFTQWRRLPREQTARSVCAWLHLQLSTPVRESTGLKNYRRPARMTSRYTHTLIFTFSITFWNTLLIFFCICLSFIFHCVFVVLAGNYHWFVGGLSVWDGLVETPVCHHQAAVQGGQHGEGQHTV